MPRMTSQIAYLGLITTIGLLLGACGGSPPRPDPSTPQPAAATQLAPESSKLPNSYALADVLIRMERTGCFGTCPIYSLQIMGDGAVLYNGIANVYIRGELRTYVSRQQVADLLHEFNRIGFFHLPDNYEAGQTLQVDGKRVDVVKMDPYELPGTRITLRVGDSSKSVVYTQTAPEALIRIAKRIDELAGSSRWVKRPGP